MRRVKTAENRKAVQLQARMINIASIRSEDGDFCLTFRAVTARMYMHTDMKGSRFARGAMVLVNLQCQ